MLGLSVGLGYGVFGAVEIWKPQIIAAHFLALPLEPSQEADRAISLLGRLLGARDLTVAALIFGFYHMAQYREMGNVIMAGTIICYADALAVWSTKGPGPALRMATVATVWTWVGMGLTFADDKCQGLSGREMGVGRWGAWILAIAAQAASLLPGQGS
ncbi:hypothetical protein MFIFM68171_07527 [Madurella fahalii]|uniref:Integral membrane protein n=1 Tax=Madurella fahalii TaxID=1157608 RepID=A0ABQ0GHS5_9PEZI